jgi:ubiquinone/menaquinone biosynthesis C-methylase UbiE
MALTAPKDFDTGSLRQQVRAEYERVARDPRGEFHFHRGAGYASSLLGYDAAELAALPEESTARFAGVGNPLRVGDTTPGVIPLRPGDTVLDHACGAGMDLLLAARRIGPTGRAIGVDMTPAMRACAAAAADLAGLAAVVEIREGLYENLPVESASVDVVLSNGVLNLSPDKPQVVREIARVLKPGGRLFLADVVVQRELSLKTRSNPDLWAACVGGALTEGEFYELFAQAGLVDARVVQRFNCFMGTSAEQKVSKQLFIHGANFYARKP